MYYSKIYQKGNWKNIRFPQERKKIRPSRQLAQLSILKSGLGILDTDTKLNFLRIQWIQKLINLTNALWKDLMLYRLNLILNYNQGLVLYTKKQSLGLISTKISRSRTMKISLFNYLNIGWPTHIFKSTQQTGL